MSGIDTTWRLKMEDLISAPLQKIKSITTDLENRTDNLGKCFKRLNAIDLMAISQSAQNLKTGLENFNQPFQKFESGLAEVSAITGVSGKGLDDLGKKARESAKQFGGNATDSLTSYKTLLSRLGPDIAKSPEALEKMEHNVRILSKTMGNDAVGSVDALTTAMLQYGVDLNDPIVAQIEMERMMNIMAAGAKEGAAEVGDISAGLKVSGVAAKQANVSFSETNAALQELAKGGKTGSEAGMGLRNVLGKMAGEDVIPKEALEKLKAYGVNMNVVSDKTLPFTTRLRELGKAQGDSTVMAQVFGVENAAAASILLQSVDAQDQLNQKIQNTKTAQEQANIIMDTDIEKKSRWNAIMDDGKIAIGSFTTAMSPYVNSMANGISFMADWKNASDGLKTAMSGVKTMLGITEGVTLKSIITTKLKTVADMAMSVASKTAAIGQRLFNAAMNANPIMKIITLIGLMIGAVVLAWNKFEGFRKVVFKGWEMLKLFGSVIKDYVIDRLKGMVSGITGIGKALMHFFKGEWKEAWETGKQATRDLLGVDAAKNAVGKLKDGAPKALKAGEKKSDQYTAAHYKEETVSSGGVKETTIKPKADKVVTEVDSPVVTPVTRDKTNKEITGGGATASTGGGGGNGGLKSVVQNLTINNHFDAGNTDLRKIADELTGMIINRLRDGVIALG